MYNDVTGPCLVEVGSRCHGGEGTWLPTIQECIGFTQVSVTLDVYLEGKLFETLHPTQYVLKKVGKKGRRNEAKSRIVNLEKRKRLRGERRREEVRREEVRGEEKRLEEKKREEKRKKRRDGK